MNNFKKEIILYIFNILLDAILAIMNLTLNNYRTAIICAIFVIVWIVSLIVYIYDYNKRRNK